MGSAAEPFLHLLCLSFVSLLCISSLPQNSQQRGNITAATEETTATSGSGGVGDGLLYGELLSHDHLFWSSTTCKATRQRRTKQSVAVVSGSMNGVERHDDKASKTAILFSSSRRWQNDGNLLVEAAWTTAEYSSVERSNLGSLSRRRRWTRRSSSTARQSQHLRLPSLFRRSGDNGRSSRQYPLRKAVTECGGGTVHPSLTTGRATKAMGSAAEPFLHLLCLSFVSLLCISSLPQNSQQRGNITAATEETTATSGSGGVGDGLLYGELLSHDHLFWSSTTCKATRQRRTKQSVAVVSGSMNGVER
nr:hypothetical protein Iba_chr12eCG8300 [Ipomoea batatas]